MTLGLSRVWKLALVVFPAAGMLAATLPVEDPRLQIRWSWAHSSDAAGAADQWGSNTGTFTGGVATAAGWSFRGTQVLTTASGLTTTGGDWCVSMWVMPTGTVTAANTTLWCEGNSTSITPYAIIGLQSNSVPFLDIRNNANVNAFAFSSNNINDGRPHLVSLLHTTNHLFRLYVDGAFLIQVSNAPPHSVDTLDLGRLYRNKTWANAYRGFIYDYHRCSPAPSPEELVELHSRGAQP